MKETIQNINAMIIDIIESNKRLGKLYEDTIKERDKEIKRLQNVVDGFEKSNKSPNK